VECGLDAKPENHVLLGEDDDVLAQYDVVELVYDVDEVE
jgi:hypothetical protein